MNYRIVIACLLVVFCGALTPAGAAVIVKPEAQPTEENLSRAEKRQLRKQKQQERRVERWQNRIEKWTKDEKKSRPWLLIIGLLLLLGGLGLGIAAFSAPLGGFFYFLAGLMTSGGLVTLVFRFVKKRREKKKQNS